MRFIHWVQYQIGWVVIMINDCFMFVLYCYCCILNILFNEVANRKIEWSRWTTFVSVNEKVLSYLSIYERTVDWSCILLHHLWKTLFLYKNFRRFLKKDNTIAQHFGVVYERQKEWYSVWFIYAIIEDDMSRKQ